MSLTCEKCKAPLSPEQVLDSSRNTWPHEWQDFVCGHCGDVGLFMIRNRLMQLGAPDGFPGPCFIVESEQLVPGLESERNSDNDLFVRLNGRQWSIPSKVPKGVGGA
jgi:hypothetical protein